jgi:hypothetical protein
LDGLLQLRPDRHLESWATAATQENIHRKQE